MRRCLKSAELAFLLPAPKAPRSSGTSGTSGTCALLSVAALLCVSVWSAPSLAQVHRHVGPQGQLEFTDRPLQAPAARQAASGQKAPKQKTAAQTPGHEMYARMRRELALFDEGRNSIRAALLVSEAHSAVRAVVEACALEWPRSAPAARQALAKWEREHAGMLAQKEIVLKAALGPRERADAEHLAARHATRPTYLLNGASDNEVGTACSEAQERFDSPDMAPRHYPTLLAALNAPLSPKR